MVQPSAFYIFVLSARIELKRTRTTNRIQTIKDEYFGYIP